MLTFSLLLLFEVAVASGFIPDVIVGEGIPIPAPTTDRTLFYTYDL